jgi:hypothetical protein
MFNAPLEAMDTDYLSELKMTDDVQDMILQYAELLLKQQQSLRLRP